MQHLEPIEPIDLVIVIGGRAESLEPRNPPPTSPESSGLASENARMLDQQAAMLKAHEVGLQEYNAAVAKARSLY